MFVEDAFALRDLPECEFKAMSFDRMKCDKYGYVCLEGNHQYAVEPAFARRTVVVGRGAFDVEVYDENGARLCAHKRAYRKGPTSSEDPLSQLGLLCMKPRDGRTPRFATRFPTTCANPWTKWKRRRGRMRSDA